jgi:hypothetical protein
MTLSNDDIEKLAQALRPQRDFSSMWDQFSRVLTTLTAAGILWLLQSTSDLKGEVAVMKSEQRTMGEQIKDLRGFASLPLFTVDDYNQQNRPLEEGMKRNEQEILQLKNTVSALERSLLKLENPATTQ